MIVFFACNDIQFILGNKKGDITIISLINNIVYRSLDRNVDLFWRRISLEDVFCELQVKLQQTN